jgi:hypothetical protein
MISVIPRATMVSVSLARFKYIRPSRNTPGALVYTSRATHEFVPLTKRMSSQRPLDTSWAEIADAFRIYDVSVAPDRMASYCDQDILEHRDAVLAHQTNKVITATPTNTAIEEAMTTSVRVNPLQLCRFLMVSKLFMLLLWHPIE